MFLVFICMVIVIFKCNSKEVEELHKVLDNGIVFSGKVIDTKISSNHCFGIAVIKVDSSNVKEYAKFSDEYLFPYRIKDSIAEIYTYVPAELEASYGKTKVSLNSNKRLLYYITEGKTIEGDLFINTSERNIKYVKKHTIFKD
jgi:hypothetical protein